MTLKNYWLLPCLSIILLFPSLLRAGSPHRVSTPLFFGVALDGYPISKERLKSIEESLGVSPGMVSFFLQWPAIQNQGYGCFPGESLDAIRHAGAIPCLTWEPMYYDEGCQVQVTYQDILDGVWDPYLMGFAKQSALWKKPFMIRFAHEMNIARYHWGTKKKGYGPESPRIYRRMFRYVVTIFQKAGAQNVLWAFCPNSESAPNASWNRIEDYYPDDKYVDVLGIDGYNWGTTQTKAKNGWDSEWKEFAAIFRPAWEKLRKLAPDKPIFVFETASVNQGGDKGLWIKNAFETAKAWKLNGLVWFQVKKENDWRINSEGKTSCGDIPETAASLPHQWIEGLRK
ncbi:MAG: endoglucanase [Deltaproteobacteria bacterium]|nr:endoglucanase [Deltaproteobacteria bacterium]